VTPTLKLSRVAVQRPRVAPGETTNLIAEYLVSTPEAAIEVKEIRVIRFEGQRVATLEKAVSLPRGAAGTSVALTVPADAAPGFYTVTTTVEPRATAETRRARPAAPDGASSVFRVGAAETSVISPPPAAAADAPAQFKLWTDKAQRKIGEAVKVFFQPNRDGYVTLVNVGTSGKITILYPNAYMPNHQVKAGQTYSVPGADEPYELTLSGPAGIELVYAVFTTSPMRFVEEHFIKSRPFAPLEDKAEAVTRDINLTVKTIPLKEQATAVLEFEVIP
jgi:hypothetical protein